MCTNVVYVHYMDALGGIEYVVYIRSDGHTCICVHSANMVNPCRTCAVRVTVLGVCICPSVTTILAGYEVGKERYQRL